MVACCDVASVACGNVYISPALRLKRLLLAQETYFVRAAVFLLGVQDDHLCMRVRPALVLALAQLRGLLLLLLLV